MVYQVRNTSGFKTAEFELRAEANHFLKKLPLTGLEVWILEGVPGELIGIKSAQEFLESQKPQSTPLTHV